jgi:AcrR family transcriptional regulator
MDAALHVFASKGFVRATNKDIAQEAGITPGLIYHYFASKDALLKAIIESRSPVQVVRALAPETFDLPPEQMLQLIIREFLQTAEDDKFIQLLRVYLSELIHNPRVSPLGIPVIQEATQYLEKYIAAKIKTGELGNTDPVLATQIILGSVMDIVLRRQILRDPLMLAYSRDEIVNATVMIALQGLLPE